MITLALPLMLAAAAPPSPVIFRCQVGARVAMVTMTRSALTYSFGAPGKPALTIVGTASNGKVHRYWGRYVSPLYQLRFIAGDYSYIVYSMEANAKADSAAVSGVTVLRGKTVVGNYGCKRFSALASESDLIGALPMDGDEYSAMSL